MNDIFWKIEIGSGIPDFRRGSGRRLISRDCCGARSSEEDDEEWNNRVLSLGWKART